MEQASIPASAIIETIHIPLPVWQTVALAPPPKSPPAAIRRHPRDAQQAVGMEPVLAPGTIAVIDRHYNSLAPYRAQQPTLYAVRSGSTLLLRFVDFDAELPHPARPLLLRRLLLRSRMLPFIVAALIESPRGRSSVGRVCISLFNGEAS